MPAIVEFATVVQELLAIPADFTFDSYFTNAEILSLLAVIIELCRMRKQE
jgi:hypothetical protein